MESSCVETDISITPANCNRQNCKPRLFTKCSSFQISHLIVTVEFTPFWGLIILLHVKTSNFKGNDHQPKKLLIVKQIFLVSTLGNVETVWRIRILMLGCKGLSVIFLMTCTFSYGHLILVSFTSWYMRKIKSKLVIWHIAGKPYNWLNFIWSKTWRAIFNRFPGKTGSRITGSPNQGSKITGSRIKDQFLFFLSPVSTAGRIFSPTLLITSDKVKDLDVCRFSVSR